MNYKEIEYNIYENGEIKETKTERFRLTSGACQTLEKATNKPILEYLQDESMTTVLTILRYMKFFEDKTYTINQAEELYDRLVDNGWTFKKILQDIIYETLVVSGFLEESEWKEMKETTNQLMKELKEEQKKALKVLVQQDLKNT